MLKVFDPQSEPRMIHWCWVSVQGPDARDFFHRLTTAQVKNLAAGQGTSGLFLTPNGKIRSYFNLWNYTREERQEYGFEFDAGPTDEWKKELLGVIDQYTFGEKITVTDATEQLECRWLFPDGSIPFEIREGETLATDDHVRICHHGSKDYGRPWMTVWARKGELNDEIQSWISRSFPQGTETISYAQVESWRIESVRPRIGAEITSNALPLELGLVEAIAGNKGCYPGQEVIEKIISLGSPPRRLTLITGDGEAPKPGDTIFNLGNPAAELGHVTSVQSDQNHFKVLGLVRKIHAKEGLEVRFPNSAQGKILKIAPYA